VAKVYGVKKADILNANSRHREARQVLIELSYRANIRKKSLVELGKELGGITGSAIAQVHKRVLLKLVSNKELKSKIENFIKQLSIVEA
jgi:chromosomal replication initiation ATPase DnaA